MNDVQRPAMRDRLMKLLLPRRRSRPVVLIVDFDFFSTIGGGQTFYQRVTERNPGIDFVYLSRGGDMASHAAGGPYGNARAMRLPPPDPALQRPPDPVVREHIRTSYAVLADQVARAVAGRHFDVVEIPSFVPLGRFLPEAFARHGVRCDRFVLGLLGWMSVGLANGYDAAQHQAQTDAVTELEAETIDVIDSAYTISEAHRAENAHVAHKPLVVIDMHDALTVPARVPEQPLPQLPQRPDLWFVGRLDRNKGPDLFVEIVAGIPPGLYRSVRVSGPDCPSPYPGGATWSQEIMRLADARGVALRYEGAMATADLQRDVFRPGSVVVVPSRADSFNYVALEAVTGGAALMLSEATGAAGFLRGRHPELPVMSMSPDDIPAASASLRAFLDDYPASALHFLDAVRAMRWGAHRIDFMKAVYLG